MEVVSIAKWLRDEGGTDQKIRRKNFGKKLMTMKRSKTKLKKVKNKSD